ncbi:MAG: peptidyl-prolyl cis-trans isomerase, partial [Bacteroidales bacterium]|nr:peptidyl-prolyl cis-trans isomerase [Bacteroidales bacterium]
KAHRDIEYVVYEVVPSEDDINATNEAIAAVYDEFCATDNMKAFLLKNSDRSLDNYWYKAGELKTISIPVDEQVFAGAGNTTSIIKDGNTFYAARVMESAMISDSVYVKHILLQGEGARQTADSLLNVVQKGGNFANLAAQYSLDQSSAVDGEMGTIGWMTQTYMIPGFESVITADVNKPFVLDTQYGSHVVLVSNKTAPVAKKKVAILEKAALASKETFNKFYSQANTFATIANGTFEGYQKALDSTKVYSQKMSITEATANYGTIDNAKEVTRWAFEAKDGKASNIITVNNNYFFVVALKQSYKEGYAAIKDVAPSIKENLYTQKLQDKYKAEIAGKIAGLGSIEAIADALGVEVQSNADLALASPMVEPALLGTILSTESGKISAPVAGILGVYVAKVNDKKDNAYYTEEDAKMYDAQKAQYTAQQVVPAMMELNDVVDNRERFF